MRALNLQFSYPNLVAGAEYRYHHLGLVHPVDGYGELVGLLHHVVQGFHRRLPVNPVVEFSRGDDVRSGELILQEYRGLLQQE